MNKMCITINSIQEFKQMIRFKGQHFTNIRKTLENVRLKIKSNIFLLNCYGHQDFSSNRGRGFKAYIIPPFSRLFQMGTE